MELDNNMVRVEAFPVEVEVGNNMGKVEVRNTGLRETARRSSVASGVDSQSELVWIW